MIVFWPEQGLQSAVMVKQTFPGEAAVLFLPLTAVLNHVHFD
jgi:hypothetical protein